MKNQLLQPGLWKLYNDPNGWTRAKVWYRGNVCCEAEAGFRHVGRICEAEADFRHKWPNLKEQILKTLENLKNLVNFGKLFL